MNGLLWLVQGMYTNARSRGHVGEGYSQEFDVKVWVYLGSVLRPLLLEALSCEFLFQVPLQCLFGVLGLWGKIHFSVCLVYWGYGEKSTSVFVWCIGAMGKYPLQCLFGVLGL